MGDPKISIIVPVYNAQDYISRCIKSVQKQHYDQWELILIDDGSKDRSGCICDEYAERDNRIRVIHQNNQGVSAARNAALKYITGQYLMFLDADDYIHPECIATFVSYANTYGADLVMARHDRLEADGTLHHDSPDWSQYNTSEKVRLALLRNDLPISYGERYIRPLCGRILLFQKIWSWKICMLWQTWSSGPASLLLYLNIFMYTVMRKKIVS